MVTLHQVSEGSGGGSSLPPGEQSSSRNAVQSVPQSTSLEPASQTSQIFDRASSRDTLASVFLNGRYHLATTPNESLDGSNSSNSVSNTSMTRDPPSQELDSQVPRGYAQRGRGSGRPQSHNRLAALAGDRLRNSGPQRYQSSGYGVLARQQAVLASRRGMNARQSVFMNFADSNNCQKVWVYLSCLPEDTTTWDLYEAFKDWGTIVRIDVEENAKNQRTGFAKLLFEPPPKTPVHRGSRHQIAIQERNVWVVVDDVDPKRNEGGVRSPLHNSVAAKITMKPSSLTFGIMLEPNKFMGMQSVSPPSIEDDLTFAVDFRRRKLEINFPVPAGRVYYYRMEVKFEAVAKVYRVSSPETKAVVISCEYPPRFYRRKLDVEKTHDAGRLTWEDMDLWARVTDITHDLELSRTMPACLETSNHYIDIGRWTTYQFELEPEAQAQWKTAQDALMDWNIKTVVDDDMQFVSRSESRLWSMIESASPIPPGSDPGLLALPFDVRYQLEVCISHGLIEERNVTRDFLLKLQELSAKKVQDQNRARLVLEYAADRNQRVFDPMSLFSDEGAMTFYPPCTHIPPHCALVRKVTVTPTRIYFHTPTLETTNRVIRHYNHLQDSFLRVSFFDELNEGRINGCDTLRDNQLYTRAFRVMNNGIQMGHKHWKFLAFGNSQIRENGAFFFSEEQGVTCDSIRAWMGRFTHIKRVAKYAARLGQCFSTTRLLRDIPSPTIISIPDVERNKYCFTDGVGKISPRLAKMIATEWKQNSVPSGFQFRMGGCKGVLVTWPDVKDLEVHIRKSQKKFSSEFNGLEIIRLSNYTTATLNRQIITILSCLGVPDSVFMSLLRQQLQDYNRAMNDRAFACKLLRQFVDESQSSVMVANMLDHGFMEANEPYVKAMLQLWQSWSVKYLKEKARIPIAESAFVLGGIDETATLKGRVEKTKRRRRDDKNVKELPEIFLQISDPDNRGDPKILTGVCMVGRNPSLHPGDIRVVKAVDVPALHHIRDVVIFPMQGDRDIPSMCSGGDLDGDDFFIIWNKDLIPNEWTHPPMDLEDSSGPELDHVPTVQDLIGFFAMYMKNNSLPLIATAHLAQADFRDSGAKDARCIELAKLHSKAVDYVKSGVPAELDKKLRLRIYPHFLEKRNSYHSDKILGQMYDSVAQVKFAPNYEAPFDDRILKRYTLDPEMLKKARRIKSQYDTSLKRIMGQMEIRTEFEVLSGFIMSKPRVGTAYKQHEVVSRETDALRQQFKDQCIEAAGGSREFKVLGPFVAAMYQVTCEEVHIALHESRTPHIRKDGRQGLRQIKPESMPLISFPWLFDGILGRIATTGPDGSPVKKSTPAVKEPASPSAEETAALKLDKLQDMEYERTSAGVFHRGQVLHLFHHDDDEGDDVDEEEEEQQQQPEPQEQQLQQAEPQEQQQQQQLLQPEVNRLDEEPVLRHVQEIRHGQKLRGSAPSFKQTRQPRNKSNNSYTPSDFAPKLRINPNKISTGEFRSHSQDTTPYTSGESGTVTPGETSQSSCSSAAGDNNDLLTFSPPQSPLPSYPSLIEFDPEYVPHQTQDEQDMITPTKKPTDSRRRSSSVRAKVKSTGFLPAADLFFDHEVSTGATSTREEEQKKWFRVVKVKREKQIPETTKTLPEKVKKEETEEEIFRGGEPNGEKAVVGMMKEQVKEEETDQEQKVLVKKEEEIDGDLEVEEVILETMTTNAFEDLAKFA